MASRKAAAARQRETWLTQGAPRLLPARVLRGHGPTLPGTSRPPLRMRTHPANSYLVPGPTLPILEPHAHPAECGRREQTGLVPGERMTPPTAEGPSSCRSLRTQVTQATPPRGRRGAQKPQAGPRVASEPRAHWSKAPPATGPRASVTGQAAQPPPRQHPPHPQAQGSVVSVEATWEPGSSAALQTPDRGRPPPMQAGPACAWGLPWPHTPSAGCPRP